MTSRGGRDRFRRDYPPRPEERSHRGRSSAPPSRHLWVGNLSHNVTENALANLFLQFGELETVAFQSGRSYAFVNFKHEEDAFAAVGALQDFIVAGSPLKIEFAKAEKPSAPSYDEDYPQRRGEERSGVRRSPLSQRDSRTHDPNLDVSYADKSKSDRNAEPQSEVLWIGFPALLKVDEMILRKAFSPFGEIEKITAFPGRSYAFVRFKNVMAACRAKETLQGKLFGNPRVHICFAKSESGSSNSGRNSMNSPSSPNRKSYGHAGSSDRNFGRDPTMRSPRFISNAESRDADVMGFGRKGGLSMDEGVAFEQQRRGRDFGLPENMYECRRTPKRDRGAPFHDFPQKGQFYDDSWDLPEEALLFHGSKKLKTDFFPPDNELPEYPFSGPDQAKQGFPRMFPDFSPHEPRAKQHYGERNDHWNAPYDSHHSGSLPPNAVERKRLTPEPRQPSLAEEWKWEGTIAKGGTPICRARCFPVGKVLDMPLPDFLDCTARTGLDMLSKHYYQAASAWVVFFVPGSDADIGFYNEFMNYLGEKQRAAVAKLDETTTLFLVPPSEFSEKVLKVPGKLSISGVVLSLEQPHDKKETNFMSSYPKPISPPPGHFPSAPSFPGKFCRSSQGSESHDQRNDMIHQRNSGFGPNWSPHNLHNPNSGPRNLASESSNTAAFDQGYHPVMPRRTTAGMPLGESSKLSHQENRPPVSSSSTSASRFQPEQLVQLASSLLGQPRQSGGAMNHSENSYGTQQGYAPQNNQFGQVQLPPPQQQTAVGNEHLQCGSTQDEEADPQKRLQATLQLAAALLQQIQQGKGKGN